MFKMQNRGESFVEEGAEESHLLFSESLGQSQGQGEDHARGNSATTWNSGRSSEFRGASSNTTQWVVDDDVSSSSIEGSACLGSELVYYGSQDGTVHAKGRNTGTEVWSFTAGDAVSSSPSLLNDAVLFAASQDSFLYALDAFNGTLLWRSSSSDNDGPIYASPVLVPPLPMPANIITTTVIVASGKSVRAFFAVGSDAGLKSWSFRSSDSGSFRIFSTPAVNLDTQRLFVGTGNNKKILAIQMGSGRLIWQYSAASPILSSPCLQMYSHSPSLPRTGRLYFTTATGVTALGQSAAHLLWRETSAGGGVSSPAVSNDTQLVFVGGSNSDVSALSAIDGAVVWTFSTGGPISSSPVVDVDNSVYASSSDGSLYSINGSTGTLRWQFTTPVPVQLIASPVISSSGTIFIGDSGGSFYSIGGPVAQNNQPQLGPSFAPTSGPGGSGSNSGAAFHSDLSPGAIAAAVICSVLGAAALAAGLFFFVRKHRMRSRSREESATAAALEVARRQQATATATRF